MDPGDYYNDFSIFKKRKIWRVLCSKDTFKADKKLVSLSEPGITCIPLPLPSVVMSSERGFQNTQGSKEYGVKISGFTPREQPRGLKQQWLQTANCSQIANTESPTHSHFCSITLEILKSLLKNSLPLTSQQSVQAGPCLCLPGSHSSAACWEHFSSFSESHREQTAQTTGAAEQMDGLYQDLLRQPQEQPPWGQ